MKKWMGFLVAAAATTLLTACGGGGGSPGETHAEYQITLRADRTELPANIAHQPPGIGVNAPYTTTLYVHATEAGRPIPSADDATFSCNVAGGLDSGALYYLDGNQDHQDDDGNPLAYRNITLGANAGGNSFHFHAGNAAGTARITCSVTNPRDQRTVTASVDITVGGATGLPAVVVGEAQAPGFLGSRFNPNNVPNLVGLQVEALDDARQPIPTPMGDNVQIAIVGGDAAEGARLLWQGQDSRGQTCSVPETPWAGIAVPCVSARTINGVAQFSLASGDAAGVILLALTVDRFDNDVRHLALPITQLLAVAVVHGTPVGPLAVDPVFMDAVGRFERIAQPLGATGGLPPYAWTALDSLPAGLELNPSGVILGTVTAPPGSYSFRVRVTDANGFTADGRVAFTVMPSVPTVMSASISTTPGASFAQAITASGGQPPYAWSLVGDSAGLSIDQTGVLSGSLAAEDEGTHSVVVRVTDQAGQTANGNVTITVKALD